ncbi:MAG: hypothetical protein ACE5KE_07870 [Methanosarcinales archaeon]
MKHYEEQQHFPLVIRILIYISLIFPIIGIYFAYRDPKSPFWLIPFLIVLEIFLIFIFLNFNKLVIRVHDVFLEFGFGIFKKKFRLMDIISCEPVELKFSNYLGIGIRFGLDGTIAYNTRFGKGIKIRVKNKKRGYVLTTDNPYRVWSV